MSVGQPVLVGGTMGTCSYVLTGTQRGMDETFGSTCHGAGRAQVANTALYYLLLAAAHRCRCILPKLFLYAYIIILPVESEQI